MKTLGYGDCPGGWGSSQQRLSHLLDGRVTSLKLERVETMEVEMNLAAQISVLDQVNEATTTFINVQIILSTVQHFFRACLVTYCKS